MGKYLNLVGRYIKLQINSFEHIDVHYGVGEYDDELAQKFPTILKPIDVVNEVKTIINSKKDQENPIIDESDEHRVIEICDELDNKDHNISIDMKLLDINLIMQEADLLKKKNDLLSLALKYGVYLDKSTNMTAMKADLQKQIEEINLL